MTPEEISTELDLLSPTELQVLHMAHWRYISLIGLVTDALPADVVAGDQQTYPHFIKRDGARVIFNDADCVSFMADITHFSSSACEAWMLYDYYQHS